MGRPVRAISLDSNQKKELEAVVQRPKASQREVRRARIILARADGLSHQQTADLVKVNRQVVVHWEKRFLKNGIAGLSETQRPGRKPSIDPKIRSEIITEATIPPRGRTQWPSRTMAQAKGVSANTVQRLWRANGIKPHIKRTRIKPRRICLE
jgi:transposase